MGYDNTLAQWLNQNMVRMYPMSQGGRLLNKIPEHILVDASIYVPWQFQQASGQLYISSFQVTPDSIKLGLGMHCDATYADLWTVAVSRGIPVALTDTQLQAGHVLALAQTTYLDQTALQFPWVAEITGTVTIGHTMQLPWASALQIYTPQQGATLLHPHCVHTAKEVVSALIVQGRRLTGDIQLVAGDGVQFAVDGNTVLITAGSTDVSVDTAIAKLRQLLGTPIVSINGVRPDAQGNFTLTGMDCTNVQQRQGAISISNPCSKPCCGQSTSSDLNTAVSILEQSKTTLNDYYVSLSASINAMTSKLALLINNLDK